MKLTSVVLFALTYCIFAAQPDTIPKPANVIDQWNDIVLDAIRDTKIDSQFASRTLAMVSTAIWNALRTLDFPCQSNMYNSKDATVAVSHAAYGVIIGILPVKVRTAGDALFRTLMGPIRGDSNEFGRAREAGREAATEVLASRSTDGSFYYKYYSLDNKPGKWLPTLDVKGALNTPNPIHPHWGEVTPFGIVVAENYVPGLPPAFSSDEYYEDLRQVKELGDARAQARDAKYRQSIASFWRADTGTSSPHGIVNNIARIILSTTTNPSDIYKYATVYMLVNSASADGRIIAFRSKYIYNTFRPETAIRNTSDLVGVQRVDADKDTYWEPFLTTPLHPEYPSGHALVCSAGTRMLSLIFGKDDFSFELTTDDSPHVARSFQKLSDAAYDCAISRIYGGIHFPFAMFAGLDTGVFVAEGGYQRLCNKGSCFKCQNN